MKFCVFSSMTVLTMIRASPFNYEIGARVMDRIADFTLMLSNALEEPLNMIQAGFVNISDSHSALRLLFFPTQVTYKSQIANIYSGFENGFSFGYGVTQSYPYGLYYYWNAPSLHGGNLNGLFFTIDSKGYPVNYTYNSTYNVTSRPWYIAVKRRRAKCWSSPYIDSVSGAPIITLVYPLLNLPFQGKLEPFAGAIAIDVLFRYISEFLADIYRHSDRQVFVVDKNTLQLIGTSFNASTSAPDPNYPGSLVIVGPSNSFRQCYLFGLLKNCQNLIYELVNILLYFAFSKPIGLSYV